MNLPSFTIGRSQLLAGGLALGLAIAIAVPLAGLMDTRSDGRPVVTSQLERNRNRVLAKLKNKQRLRFDQPQEALRFYWSKRSPDGEPMSIAPLEAAAEAARQMPTFNRAGAAVAMKSAVAGLDPSAGASGTLDEAWQALGPGNIGGRSRAFLIHRTQNNLMWTAGVAGGIWKSTDSGASWQPKGDLLVNIAVNSLIQDPIQDNVLYAGTGEGFFNGDAVRGQGIFKSTDYGETWTHLASTNNSNFFFVQKLAATRHKKKQRIYAATRTGLWRSTDFGATWTRVIDATTVNGCMDIAIQYHQENALGEAQNYVFASCGTFAQATVWRALDTDVGQTWQAVLSEVDMGRTSLAIAPSNPSVVYALASFWHVPAVHPQDLGLLAVYRSTDDGAAGTWQTRVHYTNANKLNTVQLTNPVFAFLADCFGPPNQNQNLHQGWYDNQIGVDPKDENIVWTAGIDAMRSDDGGQTWGVASYWWFESGVDPNYAHADNHAITFHPKYNGHSNRQMFLASDGGIHRTDDARAPVGTTLASVCGERVPDQVTWTSLNNGYEVTQFYHGTVYPDGERFFGGTQDNGTLRGSLTDGLDWQMIRGGDGGYVAVNRDNTDILYVENTGKSLQRSLNGGVTYTQIHGGVTEAAGNFQFIHPFAMDPTNSARIWYGGALAWRSNNGGTNWTPVSQFFASRIASWAISPSDPNRVYVGVQNLGTTTSGRIFTTNVATTAAGQVVWPSAQPRQGYVSSLAVDPTNPLIAYATYSTYNSAPHVGHVFKTTNGGVSWTRIDLTLPDMPVHSIVVDPVNPGSTLYIGTDLGVFVTVDGGANWLRENTGFANVIVEHLEINNGRLFAFTHGRSVFSVALAQ